MVNSMFFLWNKKRLFKFKNEFLLRFNEFIDIVNVIKAVINIEF